jgi:hypothetical protein
VGVLARGH